MIFLSSIAGTRSRTSRNIWPYSSGVDVAHGVGHVDRRGAGFNGDAHHLDQKIALRAGCILRRELDIVGERTRQSHRLACQIERFLPANLEFVLEVQIARCQEDMDAGAIGKLRGRGRPFRCLPSWRGRGTQCAVCEWPA